MAGGWSRDGAVSEQIEASISEELERMRARRTWPNAMPNVATSSV